MSRLSRSKNGLQTVLDSPMDIAMGDFRKMRGSHCLSLILLEA